MFLSILKVEEETFHLLPASVLKCHPASYAQARCIFYTRVLIIKTKQKKPSVIHTQSYNYRLIPQENLAQAGKSHQKPVIT